MSWRKSMLEDISQEIEKPWAIPTLGSQIRRVV